MTRIRSRSIAALLLAGSALVSASPALANSGQILTLGAGPTQRAPLVAGQQVTASGPATQVMIRDGGILSFVGDGSFTLTEDGGIVIHSGNATVLASARPLDVTLPDGARATLPVGSSSSFAIAGNRVTGHVLTGNVQLAAAGGARAFSAGQAWRAGGGQAPALVIANAAQAAPPSVASQAQGGLAAAAINGQPVGLGQALAAIGASGDVVAAAIRLQGSTQNPAIATVPAADAATLADYATQLSRLYGAPAFQGAGADLVRTYLAYLGQGGTAAQFQTNYSALVAQYIDLLRTGGVPAQFAGANEAAVNAYLDYIRSTGALSALPAENRAFVTAYLDHLLGGGTGANFTALYTDAITAWLAYVQQGGLPSHYAGIGQNLMRQYLELLDSAGLLSTLLATQRDFLTAYLAHLRGGGDPDQFAGLPAVPPVDPTPPNEISVAGSTVVVIPGRDIHAPINERGIAFTDGKPDAIPDGTTIMVADQAQFAEVHADDRFFIGRLTDGSFQVGRDYPLGADQGVHYAYLRTGDLTLPAEGTVHYELLAATRPTFASGESASGEFAADLAIAWGSTPRIGISGSLTMPGDATYDFASDGGIADAATTGTLLSGYGQSGYQFSNALTGSGRACSTTDCTIRFLLQPGGPDAEALAATYATRGDADDDRISGAAAFFQTSGPAPVDPDPIDPDPVDPPPVTPPVTPPVNPVGTARAAAFFVLGDTADMANSYTFTVQTDTDGVPTHIGNYNFTEPSLLDRTVSSAQGWEIGRFTNGTVRLSQNSYALGAGQAAHYALAAPLVTLPTSGQASYALHAYTTPTFKDGRTVHDARLTGTLGINFANWTWGYQAGLAVIDENGARNYAFGISDPQSPNRVWNGLGGNTISLSGRGPVTSDDVACVNNSCAATIQMTLGGEAGETVVGTYQIGSPRGGALVDAALGGALVFRDVASGGGIVEPPVSGTERTGQFIAYAGSGIGIDQRDQVVTTTEADGTLNKYLWTVNTLEAPLRGSSASMETGTAGGVIGWSRWADGITAGNYHDGPPHARTSQQGMHFVYGTPATDLPTSGTVSYALAGATNPTIRDGSVAPGSVTGSAAVAFGSTAKVGLDMQITIGGHNYAVATNGGAANPGSSQISVTGNMGFRANNITVTPGGPACTGASCSATVTGFLAGSGASHIGVSYTLGGGAFDKQVDGAAVFAR